MSFKVGDIVQILLKRWPIPGACPKIGECLWQIQEVDHQILPPGHWTTGPDREYLLSLYAPPPGRLWQDYPKTTWAWPDWIDHAPEMLVLAYSAQEVQSPVKKLLQAKREKRERKKAKQVEEMKKRWAKIPWDTTPTDNPCAVRSSFDRH